MTAIDRTIYRRMKRSYSTKELIEAYYGRIYRTVQSRMTAELQHDLEKLLEVQLPLSRSTFSQFKQVPQNPTLSHLKAWQDRLTWLMEMGSMEPLLKDIPSAIVKHFAAEARALDASELQDYQGIAVFRRTAVQEECNIFRSRTHTTVVFQMRFL